MAQTRSKKQIDDLIKKHLSLLASLREVFSGTDWNIQKECIEAVGSIPVGIYLKEILNGHNGLKGSEWLGAIGQSFSEYRDYSALVRNMDKRVLNRLKEAIEMEEFDRRQFCSFTTCDKEEAGKHEHAYRVTGEFGGEYGYFDGVEFNRETKKYDKKEMTGDQIDWLGSYTECCYHYGQPCYRWQVESGDEDCECVLGKEYASLVLEPLGEDDSSSEDS